MLNPNSIYPSSRSYVLKLRRDTERDSTTIAGRLENMSSGRQFEFNTAEELLDCLAADLASTTSQPKE